VRHRVYPVHGVFPSVLFSLFSDHRLDRARRLAMNDEWCLMSATKRTV
jgi:hypothetical protein